MGFSSGTPIITTVDVAKILGDVGLTQLDESTDTNATIANLCTSATDYLIRELKKRGADPSKVSNLSDFKELAARWVRATRYESMPQDEENAKKAENDRNWLAREIKEVVIEEDGAGSDQATQGKRRPVIVNLDRDANFAAGRDNHRPGMFPGELYRS